VAFGRATGSPNLRPVMTSKLWAILANTFIETIRQPIFGVLLWVMAFWIALGPTLAAFSLDAGKDVKIHQDNGLACLLLFGLLCSAFAATSVITREIETRSILTVVSKPVSRPLFLVGKYLGVCGAVLVGYYFLCLVFFMTVRHGVLETVSDKYDMPVIVFGSLAILISVIAGAFGNYVYGWHFPTTVTAWVVPLGTLAFLLVLFLDKSWNLQAPTTDFGNLQLVYAVAMIFCAVIILTAFAVALATRFSPVLTLTFCAGVFLLGLLSDYYLGRQRQESPLYGLLYALLPNFQYFWVGDALTQDLMVPIDQVGRVAGYTVLYAAAVLSLGVALFQTREVS